jgi:DNA modification methylase
MSVEVRLGDCLDVMRTMPDASVHAIVTDPPYGLGFMGKEWDDLPPGVEWAAECLRVLRPGGYLLAFGGTRTFHRLACAVEDAGFEIRDSIAWLYGSGFPKSLDVGKAIDKAAGAQRAVVGEREYAGGHVQRSNGTDLGVLNDDGWAGGTGPRIVTAPATPTAREWAGWGTALKPAFEPVVVARKPPAGSVAGNVQVWGTGGLNIAACRVSSPTSPGDDGSSRGDSTTCTCPSREDDRTSHNRSTPLPASSGGLPEGRSALPASAPVGAAGSTPPQGSLDGCPSSRRSGGAHAHLTGVDGPASARPPRGAPGSAAPGATSTHTPEGRSIPCPKCTAGDVETPGRWPANVVLDGSQADALDQATGTLTTHGGGDRRGVSQMFGLGADGERRDGFAGDSGGPSRFFPTFRYQAKAPTSERPTYTTPDGRKVAHPTVKPLGLMRWLVRLVTSPGGTVLDPFAGSGATVEACLIEGFDCIAIERDPESLPLIQIRIDRQADTLPFGEAAV